MFGISQSVRSRAVQVCTPELFHRATESAQVKDVCAQIEDALERKRRGEMCQEDYDTLKTRLKSRLPILTPHATFKNGRRLNADAVPSGLSIYDKDHIPDPRGYWETKRKILAQRKLSDALKVASNSPASDAASSGLASGSVSAMAASVAATSNGEASVEGAVPSAPNGENNGPSVLDLVVLAHVTPSLEGLRLVFVIPDGMSLAEAQRWMSQQLEDAEYDVCVKDLARPSFIVPEEYILYINEPALFADLSQISSLPQISRISQIGSRRENLSQIPQISQRGSRRENLSQIPQISQKGSRPDGGEDVLRNSDKVGIANPSISNVTNPSSDEKVGDYKSPPSSESVSDEESVSSVKSVGDYKSAQSAKSASDKNPASDKESASDEGSFPSEYDGIPYDAIVRKLVELLGGEPQHGSRNSFIFTLGCYLRYLCDDNREWIKTVIPTFGEERQRAHATVDSACNRKQSHHMPSIVRKAIALCQDELARGRAADYDTDDFGDIHNPDSYFYRIHEMPQKLPKLIKLLISRTPTIYQPAVSQAVFPPLAAHLCDVRFRYIDNVEHEATLMSILCAPTGSGKESITQPINRIMADIRARDAEQRERERAWKDECNRKGSNKDKRERPEGLVIQEVNIDMTNPAFVLRMKEAERHFLYAKVNELNLFDALKGKTNQHFRIMELAFDLGNYGQDRVGVQSVTETVRVRFNWNACCTPKKCRDYFRRVVTDGPISRISFATIERRPCGSAMPIYGTYDAAFDEELKPYIDNLLKARGLVDCPQAVRLAKRLVEENAEFARLSQNYVFENLSFRANVIAYLKACVLYVANGMKWEKSIEDFVRWSERYDLWCKLKLFGQMIYDADGEQDKATRTAPGGPKNLLQLLPDEFSMADYAKVRRQQGFDNDNRHNVRCALNQWVYRGYVVCTDEGDNNNDNSKKYRKLKFLKK